MGSRFAEERAARVTDLLSTLVTHLVGAEAGSENFEIALEFAAGNLEHHRFGSVDAHAVEVGHRRGG